jgi:hypothetical protein
MPFFPDSIYGLAYLAALLISGAITMAGSNKQARNILVVLCLHWLTTRLIVVYDHENFHLWLVQDFAMFTALLLCRGGRQALACAFLFLIVVLFDTWSLAFSGSFEGAAAVAETAGYISMLIMAGGAHADRGKFYRHFGNLRLGAIGRLRLGKARVPPQGRS